MISIDWELQSSTLPLFGQTLLQRSQRCYNVAATFVSNEHTVIIEQSTIDLKTLLQRCKDYYSLAILKKAHLIRIFNFFL